MIEAGSAARTTDAAARVSSRRLAMTSVRRAPPARTTDAA